MEETRLTASLPNLEIQILHRENPEDGAEIVAVQLKATPTFKALAGMMTPPLLAQGAASAGPAALWLAPMQASMQFWSSLMQQAWAPWLAAFRPQLPPRG